MPERSDSVLRQYAEEFADELTETVRGVFPDAPQFRAFLSATRFWVAPADEDCVQQLLILNINQQPRLQLDVSFECHWDRDGSFMAIDRSHVKIFYYGKRSLTPLLRYEYVRKMTTHPPGAHLQVHAHRDEIAYLLRLADSGRPAKRLKQDKLPQLSEIHLTVGGHRFRPCFEDILGMLIDEFSVDTVDGWEKIIQQGIERWRTKQLLTAIRDLPDVAAQKLTAMGWSVKPPADRIPPQRTSVPRLFAP
jgi:hypothetical protein